MANIGISDATKKNLDDLKIHDREPYTEVIDRLIAKHNEKVKEP